MGSGAGSSVVGGGGGVLKERKEGNVSPNV